MRDFLTGIIKNLIQLTSSITYPFSQRPDTSYTIQKELILPTCMLGCILVYLSALGCIVVYFSALVQEVAWLVGYSWAEAV